MEREHQENVKDTAHFAYSLLSHLARSETNSQSEPEVKRTLTNERPSECPFLTSKT